MIQTTLFDYILYNNPIQLAVNKKHSYKQTSLTDYNFKTIPKEKNLILNYFNPKDKNEEKIFNLVLVDIKETGKTGNIKCIKKNMYDSDLKYITISYRWGELSEELVKTPDYTAHITSFHTGTLTKLCFHITKEPDLKDIQYLWIDAISVDQQNHLRKKETILKMSDIYKKSSYILAVPDLHEVYLWKNIANESMVNLIRKYGSRLHYDIYNYNNMYSPMAIRNNTEGSNYNSSQHTNDYHQYSVAQNVVHKRLIKENKNDELKKAYQYLAYLIFDWSNRAWVISEYQIAKEKYKQHGTPLKYIFVSLLNNSKLLTNIPFFSYTFIDQDDKNSNMNDNTFSHYVTIDNSSKFIYFLESTFMQRPHMDMIIKSSASRNEDRFYAILPSWGRYKHLIKDKHTISKWNITDMLSVKLKLYEILDEDDLWNKARLLLYCSIPTSKPILPSFATCSYDALILGEIDHINFAHERLLNCLSKCEIKFNEKDNNNNNNNSNNNNSDGDKNIKEYIRDYHNEHGSIYKQNLMNIQFNKECCYLSVKANQIFIFNEIPNLSQKELSDYSLEKNDDLCLIYIPFFTYTIPGLNHFFISDKISLPNLCGTLLFGNMGINRWILHPLDYCNTYGKASYKHMNDYTFNIY
ncbi:unnamed protein product [Cunninghamella blakesleeana]